MPTGKYIKKSATPEGGSLAIRADRGMCGCSLRAD